MALGGQRLLFSIAPRLLSAVYSGAWAPPLFCSLGLLALLSSVCAAAAAIRLLVLCPCGASPRDPGRVCGAPLFLQSLSWLPGPVAPERCIRAAVRGPLAPFAQVWPPAALVHLVYSPSLGCAFCSL